MPADLDAAKYVSFTTYKKDGSPVSLPVWVVRFEDGYAFTTEATSHKVRRVMRDPRATLRVCNMRGVVAEGAKEYVGAAVVLHGDEAESVTALVKSKYRIGWAMLKLVDVWRTLIRKANDTTADCAIKVTLHA